MVFSKNTLRISNYESLDWEPKWHGNQLNDYKNIK